MAIALLLLLPYLLTASATRAESPPRQADYFIAERVSALRIYDRYQQPVRDPGLKDILPYTPFRISSWQSVMGDGLTPASIAELNGRRYFLLRDPETRRLLGEDRAGYTLVIRGAEILNDTLEVSATRGVEILPPGAGAAIRLTWGDRFVRLFRWQGKLYGRTDRAGGSFGWVTLPAGTARALTPVSREPTGPGMSLPADIISRIRAVVDETNAAVRRLYAFLDSESGKSHEPPHWSVETRGQSIICLLHSATPATLHGESSRQLAERIEGRLLGTRYTVQHQPGRIEVRL